jgi:hypothetical protein
LYLAHKADIGVPAADDEAILQRVDDITVAVARPGGAGGP